MADLEKGRIHGLLLQSIRAALEAGEAIIKVRDSGSFSIRAKEDNSPLTEADEAAHRIICRALESTGIPVLSEEGSSISYEIRRTWKELWLVDPLDGTKEFLKGNNDFTVNIALIYNNLPVAGVVYAPALGNLYFAAEPMGSYKVNVTGPSEYEHLDMEAILSGAVRLPGSIHRKGILTLAVSRSHLNDETRIYIESLKRKSGNVITVYRGSALKFCLVAEGAADMYPRFGPTSEWDTAAGHAVAAQAGCKVQQYPLESSLYYNKPDLINPWFIVSRDAEEKS